MDSASCAARFLRLICASSTRSGFSIYPAQDASNLRRVLDQHELTAEIVSL
jgi:hypothetical protein